MELIEFALADLKLAPYNPRIHPESAINKLVKSIEHYGFTNPVLVQRSTNMVVAGHARVKAARKLGRKTVPGIPLDLTDQQAKAYNIADNRLQDETEFDFTPLADLLLELDDGEFDMDLTGFDPDEIAKLMTWTPGEIPGENMEIDEGGMAQDHECPKCGYKWNGPK